MAWLRHRVGVFAAAISLVFSILSAPAAMAQQYNLQGGTQGQSIGSDVVDDLNAAGNAQPISPTNPLPTTSYLGSAITNPTSTLTRPANTSAYSTGELIANSATAASVVVPSFSISGSAANIPVLKLVTNAPTGWGSVVIKVSLFSVAPTYTNGDRGAYAVATGTAGILGQYSFTLTQNADEAWGFASPIVGSSLWLALASGNTIYWDMDLTTGTPTPISGQTFTLTAEVQN